MEFNMYGMAQREKPKKHTSYFWKLTCREITKLTEQINTYTYRIFWISYIHLYIFINTGKDQTQYHYMHCMAFFQTIWQKGQGHSSIFCLPKYITTQILYLISGLMDSISVFCLFLPVNLFTLTSSPHSENLKQWIY